MLGAFNQLINIVRKKKIHKYHIFQYRKCLLLLSANEPSAQKKKAFVQGTSLTIKLQRRYVISSAKFSSTFFLLHRHQIVHFIFWTGPRSCISG